MKKQLLAAALLIAFTFSVFSQKSENFVLLGQSKLSGAKFFVNDKEINLNGKYIEFYALIFLNEDNFLLSTFSADCDTKEFKVIKDRGKKEGESFIVEEDKDIKYAKAPVDSFIAAALKKVCVGEIASTGGGLISQ